MPLASAATAPGLAFFLTERPAAIASIRRPDRRPAVQYDLFRQFQLL